MRQHIETSGYYLIENGHDDWTFIAGDFQYRNSFRNVVICAIARNGFRADDIDDAVKEMVKNDHDGIHFGIFKTFIFTFSQKDRKIA